MRSAFRILLAAAVLASGFALAPAKAVAGLRAPCDATDPALCLLPFPNDRFTRPDPMTDTGRRIDFQVAEMPRSIAGKPIEPAEWNRNDGFSPGSMVLSFVPGLDLHQTWGTAGISTGGPNDPADHVADIGRYAQPDAPILIVDTTTGERWPFWSELDENAATQAHERLLILRPATNFAEGHRYIVALRNMRDATGAIIPAGPVFAAMRDNVACDADLAKLPAAQPQHVACVIDELESHEPSLDRDELFLAWDFTVASRRNLTERVLKIRDDAFAQLGDTNLADNVIQGNAPAFAIQSTTTLGDGSKRMEATMKVPYYIDRPPYPPFDKDPVAGVPGQAVPGRFVYGLDGLPMQNPAIPTIDVPFSCRIPPSASASNPADMVIYGHGLLGSRSEAMGSSNDRNRERNFAICATNWFGFAEQDIAGALLTLTDPTNIASMMDRTQQGFLHFLYLARLMAHPSGLATHASFRDGSGDPRIATGHVYYDGNSQGAILGGAVVALSPDVRRGVLGVPGMNYSTLLNRSIDFEGPLLRTEAIEEQSTDPEDYLPSYASFLYVQFPNKQEQQLIFALLQMLWDRGETNGYAHHATSDPLPNTPTHQIMLHVALGDFQVTNVSAEVEARTMGAVAMDTALMPGRNWTNDGAFWNIPPMPRNGDGTIAPYAGSAIVYWDSGNLVPPNGNVPPLPDGGDPHEDPRRDHRAGDQKARFWRTGEVTDVMAGGPYLLCRPGQQANIPRVPSLFSFDWCV